MVIRPCNPSLSLLRSWIGLLVPRVWILCLVSEVTAAVSNQVSSARLHAEHILCEFCDDGNSKHNVMKQDLLQIAAEACEKSREMSDGEALEKTSASFGNYIMNLKRVEDEVYVSTASARWFLDGCRMKADEDTAAYCKSYGGTSKEEYFPCSTSDEDISNEDQPESSNGKHMSLTQKLQYSDAVVWVLMVSVCVVCCMCNKRAPDYTPMEQESEEAVVPPSVRQTYDDLS
mmetsp:Transcript_134470/g.245439  ORF Transcript_134470/g.245439 Transcript_134470/m.245439 type:complete len:231 (+) Transcript_134470:77-769(+)